MASKWNGGAREMAQQFGVHAASAEDTGSDFCGQIRLLTNYNSSSRGAETVCPPLCAHDAHKHRSVHRTDGWWVDGGWVGR